MKKILILVLAAGLCACGGNSRKQAVVTEDAASAQTEAPFTMDDDEFANEPIDETPVNEDDHNAENALDYLGKYAGTLPAADCPGIETKLTLRKDGMYVLDEKYVDRIGSEQITGKYTVKGNLLTLGLSESTYYKIEEGRVRRLDADKKVINGKLAGHYVLRKVE